MAIQKRSAKPYSDPLVGPVEAKMRSGLAEGPGSTFTTFGLFGMVRFLLPCKGD